MKILVELDQADIGLVREIVESSDPFRWPTATKDKLYALQQNMLAKLDNLEQDCLDAQATTQNPARFDEIAKHLDALLVEIENAVGNARDRVVNQIQRWL